MHRPPSAHPGASRGAPLAASLAALLAALILPLALAGCATDGPTEASACRVSAVAAIPLDEAGNFLVAPVSIDGTAAYLVVDTGAETTILTPEAVRRLRLPRDAARHSLLLGVDARVESDDALARDIRLGGLTLHDRTVGVAAISHIPDMDRPISGLLGTDILSRYDVELDAPAHRMTLWDVPPCAHFVPWSDRAAAVPATLSPSGRIFLPVDVDRHEVRAQLDSGARNSLITRHGANGAGVPDEAIAEDPVRFAHGVGATSITLHRHRFASVTVGTLHAEDVPLNVANTALPGVEMLLGADWLADKRVWISFARGRLYVEPVAVRTPGKEVAARQ